MMRTLFKHLVALSLFCGVGGFAHAETEPAPAGLPFLVLNTGPAFTPGKTVRVAAGDDFQQALTLAMPGDVIELEAGASFEGPFLLPHKPGNGWIVIRSTAIEQLPPGVRVQPSQAAVMPRLVSAAGAVITTAPGAHHYRFEGIEITPLPKPAPSLGQVLNALVGREGGRAGSGDPIVNLVNLGSDSKQMKEVPHHIIFDRCYIHGDPRYGTRRGVALNSAHTAVINSWLSDFKEVGGDAQAIAGWSGPGPFRIVNNLLEAAGENVMFGGETPAIAGMVPANIEVRGNHFRKPLAWKADSAQYEGTPWSVKNLFELKNARRVLIEGNVFEHNWPHAQSGFAILFTVRNEDGAVPWAVVEDVTFRDNLLRGIAGGINILGTDRNGYPGGRTRRIHISNNLFTEMGGIWGDNHLLQLLDGVEDIVFEHNTALNTANVIMVEGPGAHRRVAFNHNVVMHNEYGIVGSGTSVARPMLERYFPDMHLIGNVFVGGPEQRYPAGNFFPASLAEAGIEGLRDGRFTYAPGASDHRSVQAHSGADLIRLCAALSTRERQHHCIAMDKDLAEAAPR